MKISKKDIILCVLLAVAGLSLMVIKLGWLATLGIFLLIWGNNISHTISIMETIKKNKKNGRI